MKRDLGHLCLLSLLMLVLGCSPLKGCEGLECVEECREEGRCQMRTEFSGDSRYRCYADNQASCQSSEACTREGLCNLAPAVKPGECVALTVEDCLGSELCREEGKCSLRGGRCGVDAAGEATSERDCASSSGCLQSGRCSLDAAANACIADSDADCRSSEACETRGVCVKVEGGDFCVRDNEPCRGDSCAKRGWCALYKGICRASSDADCAASRFCELRGECSLHDHLCQPATKEDCTESLACEIAGFCTLYEKESGFKRCVVGSDADCAGSVECERFGRCEAKVEGSHPYLEIRYCARPGEPPPLPCVETRACVKEGRCLRDHPPGPPSDDPTWPNVKTCVSLE